MNKRTIVHIIFSLFILFGTIVIYTSYFHIPVNAMFIEDGDPCPGVCGPGPPPAIIPGCVGSFLTCNANDAKEQGTYTAPPRCTWSPAPVTGCIGGNVTERVCQDECVSRCSSPDEQVIENVCRDVEVGNCRFYGTNENGAPCNEHGACSVGDVRTRERACAQLNNGKCNDYYIDSFGCILRDDSWDLNSNPNGWAISRVLGPNGEQGVSSYWNEGSQAVCCQQPPRNATCPLSISEGADVIANGTITYNSHTIRRYTVKQTANQPTLTLDGDVSNSPGDVGVEIWRSTTDPVGQCWNGVLGCDDENAINNPRSAKNANGSLATTINTNNLTAGKSYFLMCDAYQKAPKLNMSYKCSGDPFTTFPTADGWTYCGDNSVIQIDVDNPIPPTPTCSISASPSGISYNGSSAISWSSGNTTGCTVSSPGWTGTSGSQNTGALTSTTTYNLSCPGIDGTTCIGQTTVTVDAPITPTLTCVIKTNPVSVTWNWNTSSGPVTYHLQVNPNSGATNPDGSFVAANTFNSWVALPPKDTSATLDVPYYGHVLAGDGSQSSNWSTTVSCTVPSPSTPTGDCGGFNNSQTDPATPITWQWVNGTGIQIWDSTGTWWYNAAATSPLTINNIPPGRTVYARTTYDFNTFSIPQGSKACDLPPNPLPATISGPLQQKSGTGCFPASATNYFIVQNPTTTTNPSSCVSTSCNVNDNTKAQTYSCTTTFNSQACLSLNPPTWPTSAIVTLTGVPPSGYTIGGWAPSSGVCDPLTKNKTVNAGDTITNQPVTFDFIGTDWYKLKSTSFVGSSTTGITVPAFVNKYTSSDSDDDATKKYFIIGDAGSILGTTVDPDPPTTSYSSKNWKASSYPTSPLFTPSTFLNYVNSRKQATPITALSDINANGIYIWNAPGNPPNLTTASINRNVVLIASGKTVTIDSALFTTAVAIVADTITFSDTVHEANGIFIANTIKTGLTTDQGLKINGNLIAQTTFNNQRTWSDTSRPSIFVVFKPEYYLTLLPYLSISKYNWRQTQ